MIRQVAKNNLFQKQIFQLLNPNSSAFCNNAYIFDSSELHIHNLYWIKLKDTFHPSSQKFNRYQTTGFESGLILSWIFRENIVDFLE